MNKPLPPAYEPKDYEEGIYRRWEESGFFNPDRLPVRPDAPAYAIVMPPPNVTGTLHLGHASMLTIEDILIRFHRLLGERTLWLPGTDHAAIATQTKVEKLLKAEGLDRRKLGREAFLKKVEEFAVASHDTMTRQIRKMGSSCDWSREAYTLDKTRSQAVRSVFKLMYDDGLIYRGERIVNWCPRCHSTLADDEVEYESRPAILYTFKYDENFPWPIATTRPETKLGDTAVAVNPADQRYQGLVGQKLSADFLGRHLDLKIISDVQIDPAFGTGAVGVTPAHAQIDWQIAEKNGLPAIKVIGEEGLIRPGFGEFSGLTAVAARDLIVAKLKERGLIIKEEPIENNLSLCYRCGTAIEPLPSKQWFIDVNKKLPESKSARARQLAWRGKSLKEVALDVVKSGQVRIIPERFGKNYYHWMENLRDWCISRQIWFGHRVPVWHSKRGKVELILVRHGQTDWNKDGIMQGQTDIPLNGNGQESAAKLAAKIRDEKFDLIITSPLKRTSETAKLLNSYQVPIIEDDRLKERSYGRFEGLKTEEILKAHSEIKTFQVNGSNYWIDVPTAETYGQLKARVMDFLGEAKKKYQGKKILVVSHGDTLDMFYAALNDLPDEKAYGRFSLNMHLERYALETDEVYVGLAAPAAGGDWEQDEDTLDTWFSSGLWTFSTLANQPEEIIIKDGQLSINSEDFKKFHPTAVLETGYDILFFWVARMIIMTVYAIGDIPFRDVYLHGLIRDEQGRKMSKSLGNVIDPLDMTDKYGADAVRLALVSGGTPGNDLNVNENKIAGSRNLVNKLWNIGRYLLVRRETEPPDNGSAVSETLAERWIARKMKNLIESLTADLLAYRFSAAAETLREFTWNDLADWYIEASKFENSASAAVLQRRLGRDLLVLWHPFLPFVTEVLWPHHRLDSDSELILVAAWPLAAAYDQFLSGQPNVQAADFSLIQAVIIAIRNLRAENKIPPAQKVRAIIYSEKYAEQLRSQDRLILNLRTGLSSLEIEAGHLAKRQAGWLYASLSGLEIGLAAPDFDPAEQRAALAAEISNLAKRRAAQTQKLANADFVQRAPAAVVDKEKAKLAAIEEELASRQKKFAEQG